MRIYINELIRLWKTPGIITAVVIACLVTCGVLKIQSGDKLQMVQPDDYKEAFAELEGVSIEEAYALYSDREYDRMDYSAEAFLNRTIKDEIEEQATYEEYLDRVMDSAETLAAVSIFSDKDSFSYRNAQKTAGVYERLKNRIDLRMGPSKGVELWSENGITGLIIILVMLIMINEMILKDRESGQLNLLFTMDKGRAEHGAVKLLVCATSAFVVTFIILLAALITCGYLFGIGDISRPVQSVVGLKGCTMELSVAGYIMVYCLVLSLTVSVLCCIIFFIASLFRSPVTVYLAIAVTFGIEAVLYYLISDNSYLAIFKEFNLLSFLNPGRYLSLYGNVSMFGYPVSRALFVAASLFMITMVFAPLAVRAYSMQTTITARKKNTDMQSTWRICRTVDNIRRKIRPRSVSVLGHETYKIMICGGTIWIIVLFAVFKIYSFTPEREYFENEDQLYYKAYLQKYEGPVTDETMMAMEAEEMEYQRIYEEEAAALTDCPPELVPAVSSQYQDRLKPKVGLDMLIARAERLKEPGGYILYDTGYRLLTFDRMALKKEISLAIMLGIVFVISVTYLFAGDDRLYMDRVTSVTLKGRRNLLLKKMMIGSIIALVIYLINYVPYIMSVLKVYGNNGLNFPAQSVTNLEGSIFEKMGLSIGGSIAFYISLKYLIMIGCMIVICYISKRLRSLNRSLVTSLVIFVGPLLVGYIII